ncbi:RagB/SusD family nutrient uptake outer membrane protein [Pedobacter gandavensis]|uniref:RagB/SusD family nutrient uptake outer membrane protein n=1 Tax=Pedobacter gandavensis TaxID=2679963 RepID=UPI00292F7F65|nr:RagB/SusD family nutrient uptake outer membrane protein [Pedobacter gandavensis]
MKFNLLTKYIGIASVLCFMAIFSACKKSYLDVIPDNVATIDHAFANRVEAEKFLFTCYSFLPQEGNPDMNPGFNAGDEFWTYWPMTLDYFALDSYEIARGLQNKSVSKMNYWDGYDGRSMWQGIRNCNIFLENIDKAIDLEPYVKERWIAEVKFLKAYFHWYLFRMYGPIPIVDQNLPITATPEQVKIHRQPVDSVVNYISNLIDEATAGEINVGLPNKIDSRSTELGRITKVAALAIKARVLVTAASPLFNGNTDYNNLKNKDGRSLFNASYDAKKWLRAKEACKNALDAANLASIKLYRFVPAAGEVNEALKTEMSIRNAICEKWNNELIWGYVGLGNPSYWIQLFATPQFDPNNVNRELKGKLAPTLKMAELFYTKNGVPIEEDQTWDYENRYELRTSTAAEPMLQEGYQTVGLHFNREPRFYADMAFDGSKWYMQSGEYEIQSKAGEYTGKKQTRMYSVTGYFTKKLVNWNLVATSTEVNVESYPWPTMRLADLYLLYAEALNESGSSGEALPYLNQIRERAGLKSVEESWTTYSNNPGKYTTVAGLRDIIHQERGIELAFEASRFWDLRRWKTAAKKMNAPIYGWNITQETAEEYNTRVLLFSQTFNAPRDYLWPINEYNLQINPNLVQNTGW